MRKLFSHFTPFFASVMSRRRFLKSATLGALAWFSGNRAHARRRPERQFRTTLQTVEIVTDPSGQHRLTKQSWVTEPLSKPYFKASDFHSLVWQRKSGTQWVDHINITRADFQGVSNRRRWVSRLHSFDPIAGVAILKIAEGDGPDKSVGVTFVYSWREWNLTDNEEVRTIRICNKAFEPFEESEAP